MKRLQHSGEQAFSHISLYVFFFFVLSSTFTRSVSVNHSLGSVSHCSVALEGEAALECNELKQLLTLSERGCCGTLTCHYSFQ